MFSQAGLFSRYGILPSSNLSNIDHSGSSYSRLRRGNLVKWLVFCLILLCLPAFAEDNSDNTLTFYAVDFPPYEIENPPEGGLQGFDVEVVEAAFARVGLSVRINFLPWKRVVRLVKGGVAIGMLSCARNKAREAYILFSDPISYATRSFAVNHDYSGPEITNLNDTKPLKVAVVSGYSAEKELAMAEVQYEAVFSDRVAINLLLYRNTEAFFTTRESVLWMTSEMGESDKIRLFDIDQSRRDFHLCFGKKWHGAESLVKMFNEGLAQIKADGTYEQIHAKYR